MQTKVCVRTSDNVLEDSDFGIKELTIDIDKGIVVGAIVHKYGTYDITDWNHFPGVGWSVDRLREWIHYDPTGQHPECYHEWSTFDGVSYSMWRSSLIGFLEIENTPIKKTYIQAYSESLCTEGCSDYGNCEQVHCAIKEAMKPKKLLDCVDISDATIWIEDPGYVAVKAFDVSGHPDSVAMDIALQYSLCLQDVHDQKKEFGALPNDISYLKYVNPVVEIIRVMISERSLDGALIGIENAFDNMIARQLNEAGISVYSYITKRNNSMRASGLPSVAFIVKV